MVEKGDCVTFVDSKGIEHNALVTCVFGMLNPPEEFRPSINVVYVTKDDSMDDPYGNQIVRETSVVHRSQQAAHGNYWFIE